MFELLSWITVLFAIGGALYAYAGSRDVFHPLLYLSPMLVFLYAWMPMKLAASGGLDGYFQPDQLVFVQTWNTLGVAALVLGCLSLGVRVDRYAPPEAEDGPKASILVRCGLVVGAIGLAAWLISIRNVGGLHEAFSRPYSGGWDDNGYIRDGSMLMYPGFLLVALGVAMRGIRISYLALLAAFIAPWMIQAVFTSRRGPTFMIAVFLAMAWFLNRRSRPSLTLTVGAGLVLGLLMLFLVTNRGNIYLGSDQDFTTDITRIVETPDTGNEYIYGTGAILSAESRQSFYLGKRYLAQLIVRPIPSVLWPNKYEDFGLSELTRNAGTGEGIKEALGWEGANGAAPGIFADLWLEFRWLAVVAMWIVGRAYAWAWHKMNTSGGPWVAQYTVLAALSVYLVMQTMEAVIFRLLLMSVPIWLSWAIAQSLRPSWTAHAAPKWTAAYER